MNIKLFNSVEYILDLSCIKYVVVCSTCHAFDTLF